MLHKCANPACTIPFGLRQGKFFQVETGAFSASIARPSTANRRIRSPRRLEYYWLCDECCSVLTLTFEKGRGMITVPLPRGMTSTTPMHLGGLSAAIEQMQVSRESRRAMRGVTCAKQQ